MLSNLVQASLRTSIVLLQARRVVWNPAELTSPDKLRLTACPHQLLLKLTRQLRHLRVKFSCLMTVLILFTFKRHHWVHYARVRCTTDSVFVQTFRRSIIFHWTTQTLCFYQRLTSAPSVSTIISDFYKMQKGFPNPRHEIMRLKTNTRQQTGRQGNMTDHKRMSH